MSISSRFQLRSRQKEVLMNLLLPVARRYLKAKQSVRAATHRHSLLSRETTSTHPTKLAWILFRLTDPQLICIGLLRSLGFGRIRKGDFITMGASERCSTSSITTTASSNSN